MTSWATYGGNTSTSSGTNVIAGNNTKPTTWDEVVSSTSFTAKALWLIANPNDDADTYAIDIGTGAASSETTIVPNLILDQDTNSGILFGPIPVNIASGTRIAIRAEASSANADFDYVLILASDWPSGISPESVEDYGVTLGGANKGTQIDPGGTANTEGSWTEITPAASADSGIAKFSIFMGRNVNNIMSNYSWLVDIGIGSPGGQTAVIENIYIESTAADLVAPLTLPLFIGDDIAGQRIWARAQCSGIDATDRLISIAIIAVAEAVVGGTSFYTQGLLGVGH